MNLPGAPATYSADDQARMRGALLQADLENLKQGRDLDLGAVNVSLTGTLTVSGPLDVGVGPFSAAWFDLHRAGTNTIASVRADSGSFAQIEVAGNGAVAGTTSLDLVQGGGFGGFLWNRANAPLSFGTNNTERMVITAAGGVAITDSSTAVLSSLNVSATANANGAGIGLLASGGNKYIRCLANNFEITNSAFTAVEWRCSDTGNVTNFGTLQINGATTIGTAGANANFYVNGDVTAVRSGGATGVIFFGTAGAYLYFDGTTYYLNGGHTLTTTGGGFLSGPIGCNAGIGGFQGISMLSATATGGSPYGYACGLYCPGGGFGACISRVDTTAQYFELWSYAGTLVGSVTTNGANTSYNTSSDEQLKTFTGTYTAAAANAVITADPVRTFTWNDLSGTPGIDAVGWGAQTSYAVSKDLAAPGIGAPGDADYTPWGIDQGTRTPYLWAAMGGPGGIFDRLAALEAPKPSFSAYATANLNLPANAWTKVIFDTKDWDVGGVYAPATGRFTPTRAGVYMITASVAFSLTKAGNATLSIYKNGAERRRDAAYGSGSALYGALAMTALFQANGTTDYFEAWAMTTVGGATTAGAATTYFEAVFVSP